MRPTPRVDALIEECKRECSLHGKPLWSDAALNNDPFVINARTLERELAEAVDTIKRFADCVDFEMKPPNKFTPRFVQIAIEITRARAFLQRVQGTMEGK